jgi:hypothetical protein
MRHGAISVYVWFNSAGVFAEITPLEGCTYAGSEFCEELTGRHIFLHPKP